MGREDHSSQSQYPTNRPQGEEELDAFEELNEGQCDWTWWLKRRKRLDHVDGKGQESKHTRLIHC